MGAAIPIHIGWGLLTLAVLFAAFVIGIAYRQGFLGTWEEAVDDINEKLVDDHVARLKRQQQVEDSIEMQAKTDWLAAECALIDATPNR